MFESFLTVTLLGLIAGFIFAIPIAGPISIIITSNALKGNFKFCIRTALGASIVEIIYVLIAVFGLSILFSAYSYFIPFLLIIGAGFLFYIGLKIIKTNLKLDDISSTRAKHEKKELGGGFRTGLIINLTNPSFFFGILTSSFLVLSFASSIGLNTGGLDLLVHENVTSLQEIAGDEITNIDSSYIPQIELNGEAEHSSYTLLLSSSYAIALGVGGFTWLFLLARMLVKYRNKIRIVYLNWIIRILGVLLCGIGLYLLITAIQILIK